MEYWSLEVLTLSGSSQVTLFHIYPSAKLMYERPLFLEHVFCFCSFQNYNKIIMILEKGLERWKGIINSCLIYQEKLFSEGEIEEYSHFLSLLRSTTLLCIQYPADCHVAVSLVSVRHRFGYWHTTNKDQTKYKWTNNYAIDIKVCLNDPIIN